jgi:hypothetical protein
VTEWPIEARIFMVCGSVAAIVVTLSHGIIIPAVAVAVYLVIVALVG